MGGFVSMSKGGFFFLSVKDIHSQRVWLTQLGDISLTNEEYETALQKFREALALDPKDCEALASRGQTYLRQDNYEAALEDFNHALELEPNNDSTLALRGETHKRQGNYEAALEDFNRALELEAGNDWIPMTVDVSTWL
jgi:tetratricopeptide (TPR) repeat protein